VPERRRASLLLSGSWELMTHLVALSACSAPSPGLSL
jgi:hypothetical protein